jgi:hypothetical protein
MAAPRSHPSKLPPQARRRSIADVQRQIDEAERSRAQWLRMVEVLDSAGRPCRRERSMLRLAEERLELLRRSQSILAVGEPEERQPDQR